jgi:hypothetical protein
VTCRWQAEIVQKLEAGGWRVRRRGGWPHTLAEEARSDFCVTKESIWPISDAAVAAMEDEFAAVALMDEFPDFGPRPQ